MTDLELDKKLVSLRARIESWAMQRDLWSDVSFTSWQSHFQCEPQVSPCVLVLTFEGPLHNILNGYDDTGLDVQFHEIVESEGFTYELWDHVTAVFYAADQELDDRF